MITTGSNFDPAVMFAWPTPDYLQEFSGIDHSSFSANKSKAKSTKRCKNEIQMFEDEISVMIKGMINDVVDDKPTRVV